MIVTEIKQKGKSESYYISFDGELYGTLQLETLVKNHIKLGSEIDEEQLKAIKEEDDNLTCFSRALKYISSRLKTEKQMKEYLRGLNYSQVAIDNAIKKLKDYGYINDEYYAKTFTEVYGGSKGKNFIKRELIQKGLNKEYIEEIIQDKDDTDACFNLCQKKLKTLKQPLEQKDKQKLYRFLLSRGFDYETIRQTLAKCNMGEDDAWD